MVTCILYIYVRIKSVNNVFKDVFDFDNFEVWIVSEHGSFIPLSYLRAR